MVYTSLEEVATGNQRVLHPPAATPPSHGPCHLGFAEQGGAAASAAPTPLKTETSTPLQSHPGPAGSSHWWKCILTALKTQLSNVEEMNGRRENAS